MTDFRRCIGVFLFSAAFLLLELSLSRIFSVISFYHYAYMAISLALFGMAFGGVLVYLKPSLFPPGRTDPQLAVLSALFAAYTIVAMIIIFNINFDPFKQLAQTFGDLVWLILLCMVPFLIAGVILSQVFTRYRERIGTMYAANLLGSGVGCLLVIPAMNILGGPTSVIFAAFLALCAAVAFQPPAQKARSYGYALLALLILALTVMNPSTGHVKLRYSKGKDLANAQVLYSKWNSFSRILVMADYPGFLAREMGAHNLLDPKQEFRFYNWGLSSKYDGPSVDGLSLFIDDLAGSPLMRFDGDLNKLDFLRYDITALGYYLKEGNDPDVLIIGPGGGRDVLTALNFGAGHITAVEINPLIVDVAQNEFADFTGKPYSQPGVELHIDEGRNFIARSKEKYDIIQIPLVDTWAATTSGAFSLSENNLYTVEAFEEYFDHLKPDGILAVSRYVFDPPKQSLRVLALFREYCERNGIINPENKCAVVAFSEYLFNNVGTIIMKREDLTSSEMDVLKDVSDEMGYKVLWMPDGVFYTGHFTQLLHSRDFKEFLDGYSFDISPTTDNKPFFFHMVRPKEFLKALTVSEGSEQPFNFMAIYTLMMLLFILLGLIIVAIIIPLFVRLKACNIILGARRGNHLLYFASIGAAFMLFEIAMIQKFILFLGPPIYSLAIVLFSLLVFTGIGAWLSDRVVRSRFDDEKDTGHPSRDREGADQDTGKLEDSLVRGTRMGQDTPKLEDSRGRGTRRGRFISPAMFILMLVGMILLFNFMLTPLFNALIGLGIFWRCMLAVILLAPIGLLLGFPFPLGIRMMGDAGAELIPYAYGLNGAFGVLGSVLALVLALMFGFSFNVYLGIALYLIAAASATGNSQMNFSTSESRP